ncbi:Ketoglutarate semialdehyde dehydrogenase [Lunatimonas lonarensis]|uniref:Ketoglutarate semialdehyde dehydrogenase n=1 Tax=Lunatimonas lonarensis TaxID=1232681 RepID=R7ZUG7_9BACT|nr:aldehyde dehydrogenase (NADP(+)) [Lunatimonas lonarensis]EON77673.1 Ketoglutarate semialdehyde dehydrogenase [Lunatimonas lonarensis]
MSLIHETMGKAQQAFLTFKNATGAEKGAFLEAIAQQIELIKEQLIPIAAAESNLPEGRITGETGRTLGQIRLFAGLVKEGSWVEATIDQADPNRAPLPKPDIRRMLRPLGPVVVFGASNFPLAFSTAGGDTLSALAAGCTVIYKAHPAHPKTSQMVADAIRSAAKETGMPEGVFQHIEGGVEEGQELAAHPVAKAIAFTGSFRGGKALFDTANARKNPIPVFAEMGSVNPIVAFESKLSANLEELAATYVGSLTLGVGQFCTNPGLIFVPHALADRFASEVSKKMEKIAKAPMLHEGIAQTYYAALRRLSDNGNLSWVTVFDSEDVLLAAPAFARVSARDWMKNSDFQEEVFGPFGIMITYEHLDELTEAIEALHGQLTCTVWAEESEIAAHKALVSQLEEKCGRLLFKGAPTGVEVGYAMQHGGPYPSTTDSRSTSVGVYAIKRFARPVAYQDMPAALLPEELKDNNPLRIWRTVDGNWQQ